MSGWSRLKTSNMIRQLDASRHSALVTAWQSLAALLLLTWHAEAQTPTAEPSPDFLIDARKYVIQSVNDRVRLEFHEKSLLNWTNPTRQQERGATFVWLHKQRPYAIGSFFTYVYNEKTHVKHEFHTLAPGPLRALFDGALAWTPRGEGVVWKDVPDAPVPGSAHVGRLLQMRQLARSFRVELTSPKNDRSELRLAPRPLFEYASPENGVLDGMILSYVVATDPEALLVLEAFEEDRGGQRATGFRYAFARFHYWELTAYRGEEKVWQVPLDRSHENNNIGDRENISKIYNSFHPHRGASAPASSAKLDANP